MGSDDTEVVQQLRNSFAVMVHSSICRELIKVLDRIISVVPAIESVKPGCTSGIKELCSLNNVLEKAKLLLQHCAESSKLYLAITGEEVVSRCERIRNALHESLCQIQNMVSHLLATQIADIVKGLRDVKFIMDSSEEEAGRVILALLRQNDSTDDSEFEAFQIAATMLKITSPKALLIERRSVKRLLDKFNGHDSEKEKILKFLLYLLKKYGKRLGTDTSEHNENADAPEKSSAPSTNYACGFNLCGNIEETTEARLQSRFSCDAQTDLSSTNIPPEAFLCPISSRLMYDPVVIVSGQTYERVWIEKWFSEGHYTCPKTRKKLSNRTMVPNSCMKDLISHWCKKNGISLPDPCTQTNSAAFWSWETSNSNLISSLYNVSAVLLDGKTTDYSFPGDNSHVSIPSSDASYYLDSSHIKSMDSSKDSEKQVNSWCEDYHKCQYFSNFSHDMYLGFFSYLPELPSESLRKALEDFNIHVANAETCHSMLCNGFIEILLRFLKDAYDLSNVRALRTGAHILLIFLSNCRVEIPSLSEDAFNLLTSFLDSEIAAEALKTLHMLCCHPICKSYIVSSGISTSILNILDSGVTEIVDIVLKILCDLSSNIEIKSQILSSGCVLKLVLLLSNNILSGNCIKVLHNLCDIEEGMRALAETNGCIASIVGLLETGNHEVQEHAVAVLLSVCLFRSEYCLVVMKEGIIPYLVFISINGNRHGREMSMKLLHLLRDHRHNDSLESSLSCGEPISELAQNSNNHSAERKTSFKASRFLGRMRLFSKSRTLAFV